MQINGFNETNRAEAMISSALHSNRFPHSVIIEGGSYEARSELAKKTVKALLCSDDETRPCCECPNCRKFKAEMHPDVLFCNPIVENKKEKYTVDHIRDIREIAYIIPNEADRKVFVISKAELLSPIAQNALLKIIEEPPEYAVFILLSSSRTFFLQTVLSRCTIYTIGEAVDSSSAVPNEKAVECAEKLAEAIASGNSYEIVKAAGVFEKDQALLSATLPILSEIISCALRIKFSAEEENSFSSAPLLAEKVSKNSLLQFIDDINSINSALKQNSNLNLTVTRLCSVLRTGK